MPLWQEHCPFHVNQSPIHGRGMFAKMDLEYGWIFDCPSHKYIEPRTRYDGLGQKIIQEPPPRAVETGDGEYYELYNPYTFLNHSDKPNAQLWFLVSGFQLELLDDVEAGEEITINYTED